MATKSERPPSLLARLTSWLKQPLGALHEGPPEMRAWILTATALAVKEKRAFVSLDDLFLSLGADPELDVWLQGQGTNLDTVVDDVRCALDAADSKADRSGAIVVGGVKVPAVAYAAAYAWGQVEPDPEASRAIALFVACLRPGPPSFVRESFEKRTGKTLADLFWKRAWGDLVDVDTKTRRAYVVVYNDSFSTQDLVVRLLRDQARLTPSDAEALMLSINDHGTAIVAEGLTEDMRAIKESMIADARKHGSPLRVRLEPVDDGLDP